MLKVLEWALAHGWLETSHITECASLTHSGFPALRWAVAAGLPVSANVTFFAAARNDREMFDWARANGVPWPGEDAEAAYAALAGAEGAPQRELIARRLHFPHQLERTISGMDAMIRPHTVEEI